MDESTGGRSRRLGAALKAAGRWLGPALGWLLGALCGLVWLAVYALWRFAQASKRTWTAGAVVALLCLAGIVSVNGKVPQGALNVVALACAAALTYGLAPWWVEYRDKLVFLARAQLHSRRLHTRKRWSEALIAGHDPRVLARLAAVVLALVLLGRGFLAAGEAPRALAAQVVLWLASVGFGYLACVVIRVERAEQVRFFEPGWRLGDPLAAEECLRARLPRLARFLAWRGALSKALAPVAHAVEPWLATGETCAD